MIRSTNDIRARQTLYDLDQISGRLGQIQQRLSTGKQIQQPEDDPFGASRALFLRGELSDVQQYQRNINEASSWLTTADTALGNVNDSVQRVRELLVQAGNGTQDQSSLNAIASEISQLKESLREQANATFAGRYIFSGTATNTKPYPGPGNAYAGDTLPVQRQIGPGQTVQVNQSGPDVFGPAGSSLFDVLDSIQADLTSGNRNALEGADLQALDGAFDRVQAARSNVGALSNRLDTQLTNLKGQEVNVSDLLSKTEDADMAKTMVDFAQAQTVYQSALQAGARVIQPSLLDYLH